MKEKRVNEPIVVTAEAGNHNKKWNEFLLDIANILSICGLVLGGFITYKLLSSQPLVSSASHNIVHCASSVACGTPDAPTSSS